LPAGLPADVAAGSLITRAGEGGQKKALGPDQARSSASFLHSGKNFLAANSRLREVKLYHRARDFGFLQNAEEKPKKNLGEPRPRRLVRVIPAIQFQNIVHQRWEASTEATAMPSFPVLDNQKAVES